MFIYCYHNISCHKTITIAFNRDLKFSPCSEHYMLFFLGDPLASEFYMPKFRNTLSVPSWLTSHLHSVTASLWRRNRNFNIHGSVHRKNILIHIQQDATLHSLFISGNCSTNFGCYHHSSAEAQTTVSTPSGICHTVTATAAIVQEL
jgi:hypothetical protein